jgi:hypothetical protein
MNPESGEICTPSYSPDVGESEPPGVTATVISPFFTVALAAWSAPKRTTVLRGLEST